MEPDKAHTPSEVAELRALLQRSEQTQTELDRRVFHLKTLYDISKDLFLSVEPETILTNGLLMAMGTFGAAEGVVATRDGEPGVFSRFIAKGFAPEEENALRARLAEWAGGGPTGSGAGAPRGSMAEAGLPPGITLLQSFALEDGMRGMLALGPKLVAEEYSETDHELIDTLANNLVVALKNARSFERIQSLNRTLEEKNRALEQTLGELRAALRKVELLESIKSNLCKFLPVTVTRMVERSPGGEILEARERDVTVLLLDIEGYTRLTEEIGATRVNALTERYFSVFMDAIFENNGDVVETAGDGLMVLFLAEEGTQHALEAVRAARTILENACRVNRECRLASQPIVINIGICSGRAFVGASKFEGLAGDRWTYTAHGTTINVAARLCSEACNGAVFLSQSTAERVREHFALKPRGRFALKNLTEEVEVFALEGPA
jgi:class 3 adenylate cyclase